MRRQFAILETERDIRPFEVVDVVSDVTLMLREMACDLKPGWRPRYIMGRCMNEDEQDWIIAPDLRAVPFRIRWSPKLRQWRDTHKNVYRFTDQPLRWHSFEKIGGVY